MRTSSIFILCTVCSSTKYGEAVSPTRLPAHRGEPPRPCASSPAADDRRRGLPDRTTPADLSDNRENRRSGLYLAGMVISIGGPLALIQSLMTAPDPPRRGRCEQHAAGRRSRALVADRRRRRRARRLDVPRCSSGTASAPPSATSQPGLRTRSSSPSWPWWILASLRSRSPPSTLKAGALRHQLPPGPERGVHAHAALRLRVRHDHGWGRRSDPVLGVPPHATSSPAPWPSGAWSATRSSSVRIGPADASGSTSTRRRAIPGGLWEVFIGVWLIVKGFSRLRHHPTNRRPRRRRCRCDITACRERRLIPLTPAPPARHPRQVPGPVAGPGGVVRRTVARWDHVRHEHARRAHAGSTGARGWR